MTNSASAPALALVALSARWMVESATRSGYRALAIDLFGDQDTRRSAEAWLPAGSGGALRLEPDRVLDHLRDLGRQGDVLGWIPGPGCEGLPALWREGAAPLPRIGCDPAAVQRVRDPATFFGWLAARGGAVSDWSPALPQDPAGWVSKDPAGSGGWHVRPAEPGERAGAGQGCGRYYQRLVPGRPMSASFCANGRVGSVLGFNEALPHPAGLPYVHGGVLGPVAVPDNVADQARGIVDHLAGDLGLRGLGSLDFVLDGATACFLEVNPRPSASHALYEERVEGGVVAAHVDACLRGALPRLRPAPPDAAVRGEAIVFAPRPVEVGPGLAAALAERPHCHDLPAAGTRLRAGDPLCSVSARGADAPSVRGRLHRRHDAVLNLIGSLP
jgi:predicted ATP-grasp superfamily ATP-dependent carboligase